MPVYFQTRQTSGLTLRLTLQKLNGDYWLPGSSTYGSAGSFSAKEINISEGSGENLGSYTCSVANLGSPGALIARVHNTADSNRCIGITTVYVANGDEQVLTPAQMTALQFLTDQVEQGVVVADGSNDATTFKTNKTGINLQKQVIVFDKNANVTNARVPRKVTVHNTTTGFITVDPPFLAVPDPDDVMFFTGFQG